MFAADQSQLTPMSGTRTLPNGISTVQVPYAVNWQGPGCYDLVVQGASNPGGQTTWTKNDSATTSITCPTGYAPSGRSCVAQPGQVTQLNCDGQFFTGNLNSNMCEATTYGQGAPVS